MGFEVVVFSHRKGTLLKLEVRLKLFLHSYSVVVHTGAADVFVE